MKINKEIEKYLGIKYTEKFGCWEFAKQFSAEVLGIRLSDFTEGAKSAANALKNAVESNSLKKVKEPMKDDFVIMDFGLWDRGVGHIGIMISKRKFIHNREGIGVVIEPLSRHTKRVKGIYRYGSY